jgi:hypothetical protein
MYSKNKEARQEVEEVISQFVWRTEKQEQAEKKQKQDQESRSRKRKRASAARSDRAAVSQQHQNDLVNFQGQVLAQLGDIIAATEEAVEAATNMKKNLKGMTKECKALVNTLKMLEDMRDNILELRLGEEDIEEEEE